MQRVNPYATEFDNEGTIPAKVDFGFSEHAITFANNGIQLGYFLIFSNAPMTTRHIPRRKAARRVVQRLRYRCRQRTKFIR